jgi:hypothetical protein
MADVYIYSSSILEQGANINNLKYTKMENIDELRAELEQIKNTLKAGGLTKAEDKELTRKASFIMDRIIYYGVHLNEIN